MINKSVFCSVLIIVFFLTSMNLSSGNESISNDDGSNEEIKNFLINGGWGGLGLNFGLGFRYWLFGIGFGVAGLGEDIPSYSKTSKYRPAGDDYYKESYSNILVAGDLSFYYDISPEWTVFGNAGYYAQADTVLAIYEGEGRWFEKTDNKSGVCFGGGLQYFFEDYFNIGAAYHSKLGFYFQLGYWVY